jgi:aldehyde:ferredoxin oxidoreductase
MLSPIRWKRLILDFDTKQSYVEDVENEVSEAMGGKALNLHYLAKEGLNEDLTVISTGPFAGTGFPCSSFSYMSRYDRHLRYPVTTSFGGGVALAMRMAGFLQIALKGRATNPLYAFIDNEKASFHDASSLKDKNGLSTDMHIRDQYGDSDIETISAGDPPADLKDHAILFSSGQWPIYRFGFGKVFLEKGIKAIAIRGDQGVPINHKEEFLGYMAGLFGKISADRSITTIRNEGSLTFLERKDSFGFPSHIPDEISGKTYSRFFEAGREACPSCPIGCGRFTRINGNGSSSGPLVEEALLLAATVKEKRWDVILTECIRMRRACADPFILFTDLREKIAALHAVEIENRYPAFKVKDMNLSFDPRGLMDLSLYYTLTAQDYDYFKITVGSEMPYEHSPTPEEAISALKARLIMKAASDILGVCPLPTARLHAMNLEDLEEGFRMITGAEADLEGRAKMVIDMERRLSRFSKEADMLDAIAFEAPIEYGDRQGAHLNRALWEQRLGLFYEAMGWDEQGRPRE